LSWERLRLGQGRQLGTQLGEDRRAFVAHQRCDLAAPLRTAQHADRE
jgi:hypothetical protein